MVDYFHELYVVGVYFSRPRERELIDLPSAEHGSRGIR